MDLLTPFAQNEPQNFNAQEQAPPTSGALIDAPTPQLWLGFGAFIVFFLFILLLMIRARVIAPAQRRAATREAVFEPAGEGAEITFDDLEETPPSPKTETLYEDDLADPEPTAADTQEPEEIKKTRSAFVGLFARDDDNPDEEPQPDSDPHIINGVHEHHDTSMTAANEPAPADQPVATRPFVDQMRKLDDDVEARRRQAEHEERERLLQETRLLQEREREEQSQKFQEERERLYQAARNDARREAEFERRKSEAALEKRLRSLATVERKLTEKADTFGADVSLVKEHLTESIEERFAALSAELNQRLEETAAAANQNNRSQEEPSTADMADYVGRELSNLRNSMHDALQRLSNRIDELRHAQSNYATLPAQLTSLNQRLEAQNTHALTIKPAPLEEVIRNALPDERYTLATQLKNGHLADCLIKMPNTPAIAIDAHYPVDAYEAYQRNGDEAANEYRRAMLRYIANIAETLIVSNETGTSAMAYAPSDIILNNLYAHFPDLIDDSRQAKVTIVSPTSLTAALSATGAIAENSTASPPADDEQSYADAATILTEIEMLRERMTRPDSSESITADPPEQTLSSPSQAEPALAELKPEELPSSEPEAADQEPGDDDASHAGKPYRSLSPEEEAFERLEREEALAETHSQEDPTDAADRPHFPLR